MISEVVDTAYTLGPLAAYMAATVAVTALCCGHQGQPWPLAGLWRHLTAARPQEGRQAPACGPQSPFRLPRGLRDAPGASQGPSRPAPSWAHTDKEAA